MKIIIPIAILALGLGGCSKQLQEAKNVFAAATSASVPTTSVVIAANSFDALETTAKNYLNLPRCGLTSGSAICRSPAATAKLIPAVRSARVARTNLETYLAQHPGELGTKGLYDALTGSVGTLQSILTQYGVAS